MPFNVSSLLLKGGSLGVSSAVAYLSSFAAIGAGAANEVTVGPFDTTFLPSFDFLVFMDQAGQLRADVRFASAGNGSTWREVASVTGIAGVTLAMPVAIVANTMAVLCGVRLSGLQARFRIRNTGVVATTVNDIVIKQYAI